MNATPADILQNVDSWMEDSTLDPKARSFLLRSLAPFAVICDSPRTRRYLELFKAQQPTATDQYVIGSEHARWLTEPEPRYEAKDFVAEIVTQVQSAFLEAATQPDFVGRQLVEYEMRLRDTTLTTAKGPAWLAGGAIGRFINRAATAVSVDKAAGWIALIKAWSVVDRSHALSLFKELPKDLRGSYVRHLNWHMALCEEEWSALAQALGVKPVVECILDDLLGHPPVTLLLPPILVDGVGEHFGKELGSAKLRDSDWEQHSLVKVWKQLLSFVGTQTDRSWQEPVLSFLGHLFAGLQRNAELVTSARFTHLSYLLGVVEVAAALKWLSAETIEYMVSQPANPFPPNIIQIRTAPYRNIIRAACTAHMVAEDNSEAIYAALLDATENDPVAQEWFLLTLVSIGRAEDALSLAEKSKSAHATTLNVRRAWLCIDPESARRMIKPSDMDGEIAGEFLAQQTLQDRVDYLQKLTHRGQHSLPGMLWAEPVAVPGLIEMLTFKPEKAFAERNPLFVTLDSKAELKNTPAEYLRLKGYGHYHYESLDRVLLEALVAWGDESPEEVKSLLAHMLQAVLPVGMLSDMLLRSGGIRTFITGRCSTVLGADPGIFSDFLMWLKTTLIDRVISWTEGSTQYSVSMPSTVLLDLSINAAVALHELSPARRDRVLLQALETHQASETAIQAAAHLWNAGQTIPSLTPPVKLKDPDQLHNWQIGTIEYALPAIIAALAAEGA